MNCTHTPTISHVQAVRTLFLEHVISSNGNVPWPPHSPDLSIIMWFIFVVLFKIKGLTPTNPGSSGDKGIGSKQSLNNFNYML